MTIPANNTSTNESIQAKQNKYVARIALGNSYQTNKEILTYILAGSDSGSAATINDTTSATLSASVNANAAPQTTIKNIIDSLPEYSTGKKLRDTHVGGNDAVNSYYQFNEHDDVVHDVNTVSNDGQGMGRVYNEAFDEHQQILYLSFGIPDFSSSGDFIRDSYNTSMAQLVNTGETDFCGGLGVFLGQVVGTVIKLPFLPLKFLTSVFSLGALDTPTKYYDFKPNMGLYFKTVNVMMATVAANMNLTAMAENQQDAPTDGMGGAMPTKGIPDILTYHGLDILSILTRKYWYDKPSNNTQKGNTTDALIAKGQKYEKSMWENLSTGVMEALTGAQRFVGFRIEKSTGSSETGSNTTKEPNFLGLINSEVSAGRERTLNMNAIRNSSVGQAADKMYKFFGGIAEGVADTMNLTGGLEILKGSGFLDVPEVWNSSSFTKSYTFDFQFRSPYGDPVSIFYSLYIPLFMLIAGAFPRSVGQNSYSSPFIIRAYSQGMFAIPLGIIDSITIKRGNAEYGWANASGSMLPTEIDVSLSIKDLSPIMHVAISDGSVSLKEWTKILGQNSNFQEYLLTLSGVNIAQRVLLWQQFQKRMKAILGTLSNNKFNALMFGFDVGNTKLGRALSYVLPISKLPGRTSSTSPKFPQSVL